MTDSNIQPPLDPNAHVCVDGTTAMLEELYARVVAIEEKINQHETNHHYGGSPGLTV